MTVAVLAESGYPSVLDALAESLVWRARLYTNDPTISRDSVAGDFVELLMDGYSSLPVERYTPSVLREHSAWCQADALIWRYTGGPLPLPVRGVYVTAGPAGPLVWAWRRPGGAFQFAAGSPTLIVLVKLTMPALAA